MLLTKRVKDSVPPLRGGRIKYGSAPFSYRWYKDGTLLPTATGPCLEFGSLAPGDAGQYQVEVRGSCGAATNVVTLDVLPAVAATALSNLVRMPGQTATFGTTASGGGTPSYTWRHNGVLLPGQASNSLTLPVVALADAGTYAVEVAGPCNTVTQTATLTITSQPEFGRPIRATNGTLVFAATAGPGTMCVIQASTNLIHWTEAARFPNTNGAVTWTDPNASQFRRRFYRILLEP